EALALPLALLGRHFLEVFQDTALEMVDLLETFLEHEARSLLATNATSAEHGHLLVLLRIVLLTHIFGEFAEGPGLRVDRPLEGADRYLVIIAGVDQQHFRIADQRIPVLRLDIGADPLVGTDARYADGDDFLLQLDLGAIERHLVAERFL